MSLSWADGTAKVGQSPARHRGQFVLGRATGRLYAQPASMWDKPAVYNR